jgi:hypothetical protein
MDDREKALELVQKCLDDWPYAATRVVDIMKRLEQVKVLLKAQEPRKPVPAIDDVGDWLCGNCYQSVVGEEELDASGFVPVKFNFCPNCGRAVKWE